MLRAYSTLTDQDQDVQEAASQCMMHTWLLWNAASVLLAYDKDKLAVKVWISSHTEPPVNPEFVQCSEEAHSL